MSSRVQELEKRVAELEAKLSDKEEKKEGFRLWVPKDGESHYCINSLGRADKTSRTYSVDDIRIGNHNHYPTKEIAEQEAKWLRAARKLRALARELNPEGWKYIEENNSAYYLMVGRNNTLYVSTLDWSVGVNCGQPLFHSKEAAQTALDSLSEDEREVLFGN